MAVESNGFVKGSTSASVPSYRQLFEQRVLDEAEARRAKFEVKRKVQRERQDLDVRCIRIYGIQYSRVVREVVQFFEPFGAIEGAELFPLRNPDGRPDRKHGGTGQIEFASCETVQHLQQLQGLRVDDDGRCIINCDLGHGGVLKFRALPPRAVTRQLASDEKLLFTAVSFQMGNLVGDDEAIYGFYIDRPTEVKLQDRGLAWEMNYDGKRYKFELALKHVRDKAMLQPMRGDRAALLLPVRIPPKVFRLDIEHRPDDKMEASWLSLLFPIYDPWAHHDWDEDVNAPAANGNANDHALSPPRANNVTHGLANAASHNRRPDVASSSTATANSRLSTAPGPSNSQTENEAMQWKVNPDDWKRTVDFTPLNAIGSSFLYRFVLPYTVDELQNQYRSVLAGLWDFHVLNDVLIFQPMDRMQDCLAHQDGVDDILASLPFMVLYHLECLLTGGYICWQQVTLELALLLSQTKEDITVQAMTFLLTARQRVSNPSADLSRLIADILRDARFHHRVARVLPDHCMMLGRVLVTPTRHVRLAPETEVSNRVLRHFSQYKDRFIRVAFGEENSKKLFLHSGRQHLADLKQRMEKILADGIMVGGRHFEFLAFSSSQLKEHSTWFFAPLPDFPTERVREWMGNFEDVHCAAKYAARMGLCFSSTFDTIDVKAHEMDIIPDVERNGYVFSDGVGQISPQMAQEVANLLTRAGRLSPHLKSSPSAYQLRLQGCKGLLVVNPALQGYRLLVRPSMRKFSTSTTSMLEIANESRFLPGYLNRQFISLLYKKTLGVPDEVFKSLQDDMLCDLNSMLTDGDTALRVLNEYESTDANGLVSTLESMIMAGFDVSKEPFLHGLLAAIRAHLLQDLKNRTRIFVPKSANLMGVMDETATLQYGQVSLVVDKSANLDVPQVITGPIIVSKNPCFHPGDIRVLEAVDVPHLNHLRNVVVFPQLGHRPHSNEMSGGDLDGDQFFCSWESSLLPPRKCQPMDFPSAQPKLLDKVTVKDVAAFFVDHAINDNLGVIANAHLAICDQSNLGAFDRRCLELAKLHSYAVDFPRTGRVVEMPAGLRANRTPDFMWTKHKKNTYTSNTIIGRLFREIEDPVAPYYDQQKEDMETFTRLRESPDPAQNILDKDLVVDGFDAYLKDAQRQRMSYERQLIQIMNQFNIFNESELVSGCIVKFSKLHKRKPGKRFDVKVHISEAVQALRKKFHRIFEADLTEEGATEGSAHHMRALRKASAWYHVTYSPDYATRGSDPSVQLFSFAWVVVRHLAEIKRSKQEGAWGAESDAYSSRQRHSELKEQHGDQAQQDKDSSRPMHEEVSSGLHHASRVVPDRQQAYNPFLGELNMNLLDSTRFSVS